MSDNDVRAKWLGSRGDHEPVSWVQHRDDATGEVKNLPAGDITDDAWQTLSTGERQTVRDSGLYEVETDAQAAARSRKGKSKDDAPAAEGVK